MVREVSPGHGDNRLRPGRRGQPHHGGPGGRQASRRTGGELQVRSRGPEDAEAVLPRQQGPVRARVRLHDRGDRDEAGGPDQDLQELRVHGVVGLRGPGAVSRCCHHQWQWTRHGGRVPGSLGTQQGASGAED